jgi:hypothetical protein
VRIYASCGNGTLLVQPGIEAGVEFMNALSRYAPRGFEGDADDRDRAMVVRVHFKNGAAEVPEKLGEFMIRHSLARRGVWSAISRMIRPVPAFSLRRWCAENAVVMSAPSLLAALMARAARQAWRRMGAKQSIIDRQRRAQRSF